MSHQERKRCYQSTGDDEHCPPKRPRQTSPLLSLPPAALQQMLQYLSLPQLSSLSRVSHSLTSSLLSFWRSPLSLATLLPSMMDPPTPSSPQYRVEGWTQLLPLCPFSDFTNFRRLGELAKRLTCLLPTRQRVAMAMELVTRFSCPQGGSAPLMAAIAVFLHALTRGWADEECSLAAEMIFRVFDTDGHVTELLSPGYGLGSRPQQELAARNFLYSVFHHEVPVGQRQLWLRALVRETCKLGTHRLLLLLGTRARENTDFQLQRVDWHYYVSVTYIVHVIVLRKSSSCTKFSDQI